MKKLIAGVVLGFGLTAMAHGAGDPEAGAQNAAVCAGCHGQDGAQPVMGSYPKLSGVGEVYLYQQLQLIKSGDREIVEMTGMLDNMSDQDLEDLAAYFNSKDMQVGQADPDLVDQAEALYMGGSLAKGIPACAGCHSPQGKGNEPAGYPRLGGQTSDYIAKQLQAYREGSRDAGANAQVMIDVANRLSDEEIAAVASYLSGLH